jgi:hypothetical protein
MSVTLLILKFHDSELWQELCGSVGLLAFELSYQLFLINHRNNVHSATNVMILSNLTTLNFCMHL